MSRAHKIVLLLSTIVILIELSFSLYYYRIVLDWISHNLWIVIVPFLKVIIKKLIALKLVIFLKTLWVFLFHLCKLLLLKVLKTLTVRYGVFFTERKWHWVRWSKVMFLRRGEQLFDFLNDFWAEFSKLQKRFILMAFFPIVILLFLLGFSFNITRKTMVQKTQETALFKTAVSASNSSKGIRARVAKLDQKILEQIKNITEQK